MVIMCAEHNELVLQFGIAAFDHPQDVAVVAAKRLKIAPCFPGGHKGVFAQGLRQVVACGATAGSTRFAPLK